MCSHRRQPRPANRTNERAPVERWRPGCDVGFQPSASYRPSGFSVTLFCHPLKSREAFPDLMVRSAATLQVTVSQPFVRSESGEGKWGQSGRIESFLSGSTL